MGLLTLYSDNPNLGFVIFKNPASGMQMRQMRKGVCFGFYKKGSHQDYVVYFQDAPNDISFKETADQEFEYLNKLRYMSPIFVLNAISDFFKASTSKRHEQDVVGHRHTLVVNLVNIDKRAQNLAFRFDKFFAGYDIKFEKLCFNGYRVSISTELSVYHLLNLGTVLFGTIATMNGNDMDLSDGLVERFVKSTNIVDAPYYIRYLICSRILAKPKLFKKFSKDLRTPGITFQFGDTAQQRRDFIRSHLSFKIPIIDVGCGNGYYAIPFARSLAKNGDLLYHAVDIDENELAAVRGKARKSEITNIRTYSAHREMIDETGGVTHDVIVTEVVEHMPIPQSTQLIIDLLHGLKFEKMIITTPNKAFNVNYLFEDDEMRHHDHDVEFTPEQFRNYMDNILNQVEDPTLKLEYVGIGDRVGDATVTQGVLIIKN